MGRKSIDQWSLYYWMTKNLWIRIVFRQFYKKIELVNVSNIPKNRPVILAPNHQNALMDALVIVTQLPFQTIFMARADIFKSPLMIKILTFLKMLPIYRIRDGISSLNKNEEIFNATADILKNKLNPLSLFPEGNHGDKRRLRPLVKGIFRIAFKGQEPYKEQHGVVIIPVGLDYSNYQKFGQTLLVNFGKPIEVSEYWSQFESNPAIGTNLLRDRLAEELSKCMIDIKTEDYYDTIMGLRGIYGTQQKSTALIDRFDEDKILIDKLESAIAAQPETMVSIDEKYKRYALLRDKFNFRDWVFAKKNYSVIGNLVNLAICALLLPLFMLGLVNNWPHFFIPKKISNTIKDLQFRSTIAWGSGTVIQLFYYLLLTILAISFFANFWFVLLYVSTLPLSGLIAYRIRNFYVKTVARIRYTLKIASCKELKEAQKLHADILNDLNKIVT